MEIVIAAFLLGIVLIVFLSVLAARYLGYRETVALAERGLLEPRPSDGRGTLRWGIVVTFLGLATMCGLYPLGWTVARDTFPLNFGPWMLLGLLPTGFGLALLTIHALGRREAPDEWRTAPGQQAFGDDGSAGQPVPPDASDLG